MSYLLFRLLHLRGVSATVNQVHNDLHYGIYT